MKPILEIQNISKKFRIQHENQPYLNLRDSLTSVFKKKTTTSEEFYALKDVSFTVNPGESIGIIGRNGAGKSTLLKILSSITPPSSGKIITRGRIASLLEVGTGFHPELTGRENVFLNGSILGMRRHEILKNFDAIVDFAGVEKFIDTPLKHYSSGMQVRLAFAVAAFLENEILVIDEVLAVGDAAFQKKCLGKMEQVANSGRTVLFVSHNMQVVGSLCSKGILLNGGMVEQMGETNECIKKYNKVFTNSEIGLTNLKDRLVRTNTEGNILFKNIQAYSGEKKTWDFKYNEDITFKIQCNVRKESNGAYFYFALLDPVTNDILSNVKTVIKREKLLPGEKLNFEFKIPQKTLRVGQFDLYFIIGRADTMVPYDVIDKNVNIPTLNIESIDMDPHINMGIFSLPHEIIFEEK